MAQYLNHYFIAGNRIFLFGCIRSILGMGKLKQKIREQHRGKGGQGTVQQGIIDLFCRYEPGFPVNGIAHITGGGLIGNTKRLLTDNQSVKIDWNAWKIPPVFNLIKKIGDVPDEDMRRTFNLGIGLVFIVGKQWADPLQAYLSEKNYQSYRIGEIV